MSSKTTLEQYCHHCGSEYMITWNEDEQIEEPIFCPFCAQITRDEDLDFDDQD